MRSSLLLVALGVASLATSACRPGHQAAAPGVVAVAPHRDETPFFTTTRRIPLRFIEVLPAGGAHDPHLFEGALRATQLANVGFAAVGVHFDVRSFEAHPMPSFHDLAPVSESPSGNRITTWAAVWRELAQVYPDLTPEPPGGGQGSDSEADWLRLATTTHGNPDEIPIMLVGSVGSNGNWAAVPWAGRGLVIVGGALISGPSTLVHEMGHQLGLEHTFAEPSWNAVDPITLATRGKHDHWDLVWAPGPGPGQHRFFQDATSAAPFEDQLHQIDASNNCTSKPSGYLECTISAGADAQVLRPTDPALGGMSFSVPQANARTALGTNAMNYLEKGEAIGFSDSQAHMVRKFLAMSVPISDARPAFAGHTGRLEQTGVDEARRLADKLDFDGDGLRDLAVWEPPHSLAEAGTVLWLASSKNFQQGPPIRVGALGDEPVPGDYDGDGLTDMAFFRRYGPLGNDPFDPRTFLVVCPSRRAGGALDCGPAHLRVIPLGTPEDVPVRAVDLLGNGIDGLLLHRPRTGTVLWRSLASRDTWMRELGAPRLIVGAGKLDADQSLEVWGYDRQKAELRLLPGGPGGAAPQATEEAVAARADLPLIVGRLPASLRPTQPSPQTAGSFRARIGAFPVPGHGRLLDPADPRSFRDSFVLFQPSTSSFHALWDPLGASPEAVCVAGNADDQPMTGALFEPGSLHTTLAFARGNGEAAVGLLSPDGAACRPSRPLRPVHGRLRNRTEVMRDMTGDHVGDLIETMTASPVVIMHPSNTGFQTEQILVLPGAIGSELL